MKEILPNEEGVDDKTVDPQDDIGPVHYLLPSYNIGDFLFILTYTQLSFFFHLGQTTLTYSTQCEVYLI